MLREAAEEAGANLAETTDVTVTTGPGTFTGQRVGVALAQGLGFASRARLYAASSLQAIAATALRRERLRAGEHAGERLAVIVDAGRGDVYWQIVDIGGAALASPVKLTASEAAESLNTFSGLLTGPAAAELQELAGTSQPILQADGLPVWANARDLHQLARQGRLAEVSRLRPHYLREADAEPSRNQLPRRPIT